MAALTDLSLQVSPFGPITLDEAWKGAREELKADASTDLRYWFRVACKESCVCVCVCVGLEQQANANGDCCCVAGGCGDCGLLHVLLSATNTTPALDTEFLEHLGARAYGRTLVTWACTLGNETIVQLLLEDDRVQVWSSPQRAQSCVCMGVVACVLM